MQHFMRIAGARSAEQFGIRGVKSFWPQHHFIRKWMNNKNPTWQIGIKLYNKKRL